MEAAPRVIRRALISVSDKQGLVPDRKSVV